MNQLKDNKLKILKNNHKIVIMTSLEKPIQVKHTIKEVKDDHFNNKVLFTIINFKNDV